MKLHRFFAVVCALLGLSGCPQQPGGITSVGNQMSVSTYSSVVDPLAESAIQGNAAVLPVPGISVAIAKGQQILYAQGYGYANASTGQPVTPSTVFELGSLTKQFTSAMVLQLTASRGINLSAPVGLYVPGTSLNPAITVQMLLQQTSGLPDYTSFYEYEADWQFNGVSEDAVISAIAASPPAFAGPPGSEFSYSNSNYFLLGTILENVTGIPYGTLVATRLTAPLRLGSLTYALPSPITAAVGYVNGPTAPIARSAAFAAGALSADATDVVLWLNDLRTGQVINPSLFSAMVTPPDVPSYEGGLSNYGDGLFVGQFNGRPVAYHEGAIPGFDAFDLIFLDDGLAIAVLTNAYPYDPTSLAYAIVNAVCSARLTC